MLRYPKGPLTVPASLAHAVASWGDGVFLQTMGEHPVTFAQADRESDRIAAGLAALGVVKGDRVCTLLDTHAEAVIVWLAILKLGAVSAPINTSYLGEFLRHQVADCGARVVIAESHYVERVAALKDGLPDVGLLVVRGAEGPVAAPWPVMDYGTLARDPAERPVVDVHPADLAMLIYTSGTTGPSKGCMLSQGYMCQHANTMVRGHDMQRGDVVWMPLPLFHLTGLVGLTFNAVRVGATIDIIPKFSVSNFWNEIEKSKATMALLMGSMLALVARAPETVAERRCVGQLQKVIGAPLPEDVKIVWQQRFGVKRIGAPGYGQTECAIAVALKVGEPQKPGTTGQRFEDYDVRILDDNGEECPPNVTGEICIRPNVVHGMFDGYWNQPEQTALAWRNLWMHTGDLGQFDDDGNMIFVDRKKDYLRKGGENISSTEMDMAFMKRPEIQDVCIHAVPSELAEDEVKVTYVLSEGAELDERTLCAWAMENIPDFAVPRYYERVADLPRTPNGKVRKVELREAGITAATWDRQASDLAKQPRRKAEALQ
jgi:crotonobetaine/carnitine-CoA ligase